MAHKKYRLPRWMLSGRDQAVVAVLLFTFVAFMTAWWVLRGGCTGRLVEVDRAARHEYRFQLDINTTDWPKLAELPGIGEVMARRIVAYREKHGPFAVHEDLCCVQGIGEKRLDRIRVFLLPTAAER